MLTLALASALIGCLMTVKGQLPPPQQNVQPVQQVQPLQPLPALQQPVQPLQPLQPLPQFGQLQPVVNQPGGQFVPQPEFFCQVTPAVPAARTQAQCLRSFFAPTLQQFCTSVATFCTQNFLELCPSQATFVACQTCIPMFQQFCQQQQLQPQPQPQPQARLPLRG